MPFTYRHSRKSDVYSLSRINNSVFVTHQKENNDYQWNKVRCNGTITEFPMISMIFKAKLIILSSMRFWWRFSIGISKIRTERKSFFGQSLLCRHRWKKTGFESNSILVIASVEQLIMSLRKKTLRNLQAIPAQFKSSMKTKGNYGRRTCR